MNIKWSNFLDKVYGFWVSYGVSATNSAPYEGYKGEIPADGMSLISDFISQYQWFDTMILWVNAVKKYGTSVNGEILTDYFTNGSSYCDKEGAIIRRNSEYKILPDYSGNSSNYFLRNSTGGIARAPFWGTMFPGSPKNAALYASVDASIDHTDDAVTAASYVAALFSIAYAGKKDIRQMLIKAMEYVDSDDFKEYISKIIEYCDKYNDIYSVRNKIINRYGNPNYTDFRQNLGFIVSALLLGDGDFASTFVYALSCGFDTAVNTSVCSSLIGVILGGEALHYKFNYSEISINPDVLKDYSYSSLRVLSEDTAYSAMIMSDSLTRTVFKDNPVNDVVNPEVIDNEKLEISVSYNDGDPFVRPGASKEITVNVTPNVKGSVKGTIKLKGPSCFTVKPNGYTFSTRFFKAKVKFTVTLKEDAELVPSSNHFTVETLTVDDELFSKQFGLIPLDSWKLFGPFSENVRNIRPVTDGRNYISVLSDSVSDSTALSNISLFKYGMKSDISAEYLEEQLLGNQALSDEYLTDPRYFENTVYVNDSHFTLDEFLFNKMPSVVYLVKDIYVPEDCTLCVHVGYSEPFRLWKDGDLIAYSDDCAVWSPDNRIVKHIHFERGTSRLVFKVSRFAGSGEYSLYFTDNGPNSKIYTEFCNCIS